MKESKSLTRTKLSIVKAGLSLDFVLFYCSSEGCLPAVLREVQLNLVDPSKCKNVLQTVKSSIFNLRLTMRQPAMTVICAGPEGGGKDACQVQKMK